MPADRARRRTQDLHGFGARRRHGVDMTLLIAGTATLWVLGVAVVASLCTAAGRGDRGRGTRLT
jgi:hypothetical protein